MPNVGAQAVSIDPWKPIAVLDVDVAAGFADVFESEIAWTEFQAAWVLVRVFSEPLGIVQMSFGSRLPRPEALEEQCPQSLLDVIRARLEGAGVTWKGHVPTNGCVAQTEPPFLVARSLLFETGPSLTAVICTRNQPEGLRRCLASLQDQSYPHLTILVVDNASTTSEPRKVAVSTDGPFPVRYAYEPRPGLSYARNRSLVEASTELIAWIDDDEIADPHWAVELVRGFRSTPNADSVCGVMVPAEFQSPAQFWFEEYGGHSKGRGFTPAVFDQSTSKEQSPLFPLPPFGTGGNMAMRRSSAEALGGFDTALGAGTPTMGAEDTKALTDIMLSGGTVRYQPSAVTRHFHRQDLEALSRQLYGYGLGLTAFYTSLVIDRPSLVPALLRLAPSAWKELHDPAGKRLGEVSRDFPKPLLDRHRKGMLAGPGMYLFSRWKARHPLEVQQPIE